MGIPCRDVLEFGPALACVTMAVGAVAPSLAFPRADVRRPVFANRRTSEALEAAYWDAPTDAMPRAGSAQVAPRSLSVESNAIDVRVEGMDLDYLRDAAVSLAAGGVGGYPVSGFVDVDVGRVRCWTGD